MTQTTPKGSNTYHTQQILTASPARLVTMLYEKAITSLRLAIAAIEDGDIKARWAANLRAVEIIEHLSMTLDTDKGGEFAEKLEPLYPFMIKHLINVDVHNDPEPARQVIALLEPLRDSWRSLDRRMAQGNITNQASASPVPAVATDPAAAIDLPPGGRISATA
jgi:flagellar protein FliS